MSKGITKLSQRVSALGKALRWVESNVAQGFRLVQEEFMIHAVVLEILAKKLVLPDECSDEEDKALLEWVELRARVRQEQKEMDEQEHNEQVQPGVGEPNESDTGEGQD